MNETPVEESASESSKDSVFFPYSFGWIPDLPNQFDVEEYYYPNLNPKLNHPKRVDLRSQITCIHDQKGLNTSVIFAILSAFTYDRKRRDTSFDFKPSAMFLYYNTIAKPGESAPRDVGCRFEDAFRAFYKFGVCSMDDHPDFNPSHQFFYMKPSKTAYRKAQYINSIEYKKVPQDLRQLQDTLRKGYPIMFGFVVFESFADSMKWNQARDPMPIPKANERRLGLQGALIVGFSEDRNAFLIQTSWGKEFGNKSRFFMPYEYITSPLCKDFYILRSVGNDEMIVSKDSVSKESKVESSKVSSSSKSSDQEQMESADLESVEPKRSRSKRRRRKRTFVGGVRFKNDQEDLVETTTTKINDEKKNKYNLISSEDEEDIQKEID